MFAMFGSCSPTLPEPSKTSEVPGSQLEKALDNKMMFDGSSIEGFVRIEESDMYWYLTTILG